MGVSVKILGLPELEAKLKSIDDKLQKKIVKKALKKGIQPVLDAARSKVSKRSGDLSKSIKAYPFVRGKRFGVKVSTSKGSLSKAEKTRRKRAANKKEGGDASSLYKGNQFYGAFLEFGTKHQPARPYLRPALQSNKSKVLQIVGDEIASELKKINK